MEAPEIVMTNMDMLMKAWEVVMDASETLMRNPEIVITNTDRLMKAWEIVMNEAIANKMVCAANMEDLALIMVDIEKSMMLCLTGKEKGVDH